MTAADYLATLAPPAKRKATPKKRTATFQVIEPPTGFIFELDEVIAFRSALVVTARTNSHIHWRKRHAIDQEDRAHGRQMVEWRGGKHPQGQWKRTLGEYLLAGGGTIHVEFTRLSTATCDDDNLPSAFKAVRDGIAEALGIDDGSDRYVWSYGQRRIKRGEVPGFEVVLWAERVKP
jgi:hypothetical protein